jgi:hypothetical protein
MRVLHNLQFARHTEVRRMGDPGGTGGDHGVYDFGSPRPPRLAGPSLTRCTLPIGFRIRCGRKSKYAQMPLEEIVAHLTTS